jgi:endonuclease/exonuclease/phosphatase family metal-dependent hydrolase
LGHIEKETEHFQKRGNVLLCGDFNARVGSENDFIYQALAIWIAIFVNFNVGLD